MPMVADHLCGERMVEFEKPWIAFLMSEGAEGLVWLLRYLEPI
jgi:hypothetical protein